MKIGLVSLGCPKNLVDSEVMLGLARDAGHSLTPDPASADVIVVNTCAFIDSAKQESIDAILEMARHKTEGHCQRLVVTGCLAERYRETLQKEIPEIDAILGTGEVPEIVRAIGGSTPQSGEARPLTFYREPRVPSSPPISTTRRHRVCLRHLGITRTSRSQKGATTNARSASSRRSVVTIARARLIRSCAKRSRWRHAA
jgi:tRNA A37 methylthiotransferase MiaB